MTDRLDSRALVGSIVAAAVAVMGCKSMAQDRPSTGGKETQSAAVNSGYAPVNGLKMYYEIHGTGRPLVLLHGGGSTIDTSFGSVLQSFARTRRVVAFEQQGHGRTADVDRPFSFEQSAD